MAQVRTIDGQWFDKIVKLLEARGVPTQLILRGVGIEQQKLSKPDARVPYARYVALIEAAARQSENPCF